MRKQVSGIFFLLFIFLFSCGNSKKVSKGSEEFPEILFLFFEIDKVDDASTVSFINLKSRVGTIKLKTNYVRNPNSVLSAGFYDKEKLLFEVPVDHPLQKTFETSHNKTKHLHTFTKEMASGIFTIRIQKDKRINEVRFKEMIDGKTTELNTINLEF